MKPDGTEGCWRWSMNTYKSNLNQDLVEWVETANGWQVYAKQYLDENAAKPPETLWLHSEVNHNHGAAEELKKLLGGKFFDSPKPKELIMKMLKIATDEDSIVFDFFGGLATTAHAVMQLNAEDNGNRRFIMVQLPEATDEKSEAYKAGYKNICEIGKDRIRRAGEKIRNSEFGIRNGKEHLALDNSEFRTPNSALDTGFRVLKLDTSNLVAWDSTPITDGNQQTLYDRLDALTLTIKPNRSPLDIVFEVMLKMGVHLSYVVSEITVGSKNCFSIGEKAFESREDCLLLLCLEKWITPEDITAFCDLAPAKIIAAEEAFEDDTALSNAHYILRDRDIEMKLL
jgi:adenine-specific DNA-methyltransferase